ncbi:Uncharacterized protein GBIM_11115 [Gryllus bimaculatus]|nr:Uncharacterized protein GBIM_11115 [Gryllus bimaculatus]
MSESLSAWLVLGAVYTPSGGPVYVNPAAAPAAAPSANTEQFVTQTVYGFLDFTTTIGNTVMVFSPQSAPAAEEEEDDDDDDDDDDNDEEEEEYIVFLVPFRISSSRDQCLHYCRPGASLFTADGLEAAKKPIRPRLPRA